MLFLVLIPVLVSAANIVPCTNDCDFDGLMKLVNNIINWIIMISFPVAAGVFAWAGFKLMTTGISDERNKAKDMFWKVFWGFIAILSAWIIVTTITDALLSDGSNGTEDFKSSVPVQGVKKTN